MVEGQVHNLLQGQDGDIQLYVITRPKNSAVVDDGARKV